MSIKVVKRDGRKVTYDVEKIREAVRKAFIEVYEDGGWEDEIDHVTTEVDKIIQTSLKECRRTTARIEGIQDIVENVLMDTDKAVAKAYITYRYKHALVRDKYKELMLGVEEKVMAKDVKNQNANVDERSFGGRIGEVANLVMKQYALDYIMSPMSRDNHLNNEIYIHDLDHYAVGSHNCLSIPFDDLLANGFNTRQTDVRPAQSVSTAFQLLAVIFQLQSLQQFGGVSATHLDWTMVPYVKKSFRKHYIAAYLKSSEEFLNIDLMRLTFTSTQDAAGIERNALDDWVDEHKQQFYDILKLNEDDITIDNRAKLDPFLFQSALYDTLHEIVQAIEGMYHNLNTLQSRSGNQLPFTSINYGTCTLTEGRLITRALLEASLRGVGKVHKTSIFPCGIFQIKKGVNKDPGDPNYDLKYLAMRSTAQRLYPNYANVDWSGNAGYDESDPTTYFSTMGCRTANGWDINGLKQQKDGRGNICPVTIIMPTLAMEVTEGIVMSKFLTRDDCHAARVDSFMKLLEQKIEEAKDMLLERFEWICSQSPSSAKFMYENNVMAGYDGKDIRSALKHGTLVIGQLGLAETLQALVGYDHTDPRGMEIAKKIEQLFKDKCAEYKKKYSLNFGVYYTPAENLCYTAMQKFKEKYGVIPGVSDREFFTNSMHVPVWKKVTAYEKIKIESELTGYSNAGCITYVELPSTVKNNIPALESIIDFMYDNDIPYGAVNVPNDTCLDCGYTDEFDDHCPQCGSHNIQQLRRVTGYLTGDYSTAFNKGKQQEVQMRTKHMSTEELEDVYVAET